MRQVDTVAALRLVRKKAKLLLREAQREIELLPMYEEGWGCDWMMPRLKKEAEEKRALGEAMLKVATLAAATATVLADNEALRAKHKKGPNCGHPKA